MKRTPLARMSKPRRKRAVEVLCRMGFALDPQTGKAESQAVHWWAETPRGRERLCDGLGEADGLAFGLPDELRSVIDHPCVRCITISVDSQLNHDAGKSAIVIGLDQDYYTGADE